MTISKSLRFSLQKWFFFHHVEETAQSRYFIYPFLKKHLCWAWIDNWYALTLFLHVKFNPHCKLRVLVITLVFPWLIWFYCLHLQHHVNKESIMKQGYSQGVWTTSASFTVFTLSVGHNLNCMSCNFWYETIQYLNDLSLKLNQPKVNERKTH